MQRKLMLHFGLNEWRCAIGLFTFLVGLFYDLSEDEDFEMIQTEGFIVSSFRLSVCKEHGQSDFLCVFLSCLAFCSWVEGECERKREE